ncbi:MAG: ABC transporter ATP-binding protein [Planctomycetota bacterium]
MSEDAFIICEDLTKSYRKGPTLVTPLQDLTLHVRAGEFVSLMGPSGSGKTTLLNCIAGIDQPTGGRLVVGGIDLTRLSRSRLAKWRAGHVGYIFQLYHLVPVLTAFENVELPLLLQSLSRRERRERTAEALSTVGLEQRADHYPRQLSGGQEQRVAIARALVAQPRLLVADEPTGDLDAAAAEQILDLLQRLSSERGKTIVMVTHDAKAAARADRMLHLDKGCLLEGVA